jgi:hypothetical protein
MRGEKEVAKDIKSHLKKEKKELLCEEADFFSTRCLEAYVDRTTVAMSFLTRMAKMGQDM